MANIADIAQMVQDLYFQDYRKGEDFFQEVHFIYLCGVSYSKIVEDEYKQARREAFAENGIIDVQLSDEWLLFEKLKVSKADEEGVYKAELKHPVFSFPFDPNNNGIQTVRNLNFTGCKEFIRIPARRKWAVCRLPVSDNVYFYTERRTMYFVNAKCGLDKADLQVGYVSDPSDESFGENGGDIPTSKVEMIIRSTLDLLKKAAAGVVVDMTNNANPNKRLQTEVDTVFQDDLRTKPIS